MICLIRMEMYSYVFYNVIRIKQSEESTGTSPAAT